MVFVHKKLTKIIQENSPFGVIEVLQEFIAKSIGL